MKKYLNELVKSMHCAFCANSSDVRNAMRYC